MVFGQLEQQRVIAGLERRALQYRRHGERRDHAGEVQREQHQPLQVERPHRAHRDEGADQQRIDGQPRRAGHQRRDQDGGHAVADVGDRARGHDARHGAGEARQQRDEGPARQPDAAHHPVEQVGGARQVAAFLESQDEQEQKQDLWQEHQHAARAGDHAVHQQAAQRALRQHDEQPLARARHAGIDQLHRQRCPAEHGLEHCEQQRRQHREAGDRMQHHGIEPCQGALAGRLAVADDVEDAAGLALRVDDLGGRRVAVGQSAARRWLLLALQFLDQRVRPAGGHGDRLDHRQAELRLQCAGIETVATRSRDVAHVEGHHQRQAQRAQLEHQPQVESQVGGVQHADHDFGWRLASQPAEHRIARDRLVERGGRQAVGAGQVEDSIAPAARPAEAAFLALDRYAGVVGHLLVTAGEAIEKRRLAAVGDADQREPEFGRRSLSVHVRSRGCASPGPRRLRAAAARTGCGRAARPSGPRPARCCRPPRGVRPE